MKELDDKFQEIIKPLNKCCEHIVEQVNTLNSLCEKLKEVKKPLEGHDDELLPILKKSADEIFASFHWLKQINADTYKLQHLALTNIFDRVIKLFHA